MIRQVQGDFKITRNGAYCEGLLPVQCEITDGADYDDIMTVYIPLAKEHGFQYIVTMNSDAVPKEVPAGFKLEDHALNVRLTDASEDGGLFGFRFD